MLFGKLTAWVKKERNSILFSFGFKDFPGFSRPRKPKQMFYGLPTIENIVTEQCFLSGKAERKCFRRIKKIVCFANASIDLQTFIPFFFPYGND